jgi:hypothetical protein
LQQKQIEKNAIENKRKRHLSIVTVRYLLGSPLNWFSQRRGLKKVKTGIQVDSMDGELRNRLWNVLKIYWDTMEGKQWISESRNMKVLFTRIWHNYFKQPIDTMPQYWEDLYKEIREYFFKCEWYEVYDLMEFVANNHEDNELDESFKEASNSVLESELSAYRFVGRQVTEVTSKEEISEIEQALETPLKTVNAHMESALKLMSDRKAPDYRNSIKESISAVEAICRIISNNKNATLGQALDIMEKKGKIELHKALKKAFDSLYGFTSSSEGIRHALLDEKTSLSLEDAKFMLVSCSAFINYLVSKASKVGLDLGN